MFNFSYVCSEPVLVFQCFSRACLADIQYQLLVQNSTAKGPFPYLRENGTFFEFFLCSSRACLGKIMHFIYKWRKKDRFLTIQAADLSAVRRVGPGMIGDPELDVAILAVHHVPAPVSI